MNTIRTLAIVLLLGVVAAACAATEDTATTDDTSSAPVMSESDDAAMADDMSESDDAAMADDMSESDDAMADMAMGDPDATPADQVEGAELMEADFVLLDRASLHTPTSLVVVASSVMASTPLTGRSSLSMGTHRTADMPSASWETDCLLRLRRLLPQLPPPTAEPVRSTAEV